MSKLNQLKEIVQSMINHGGTEEDLPAVIAHIDRLSQESDWVSVEEIVKDIHFLRDKAEHPLVKIAYNMAVTVVKSHYYENTLPNKPKQ